MEHGPHTQAQKNKLTLITFTYETRLQYRVLRGEASPPNVGEIKASISASGAIDVEVGQKQTFTATTAALADALTAAVNSVL